MCFNIWISVVMLSIGLIATLFFLRKKESFLLWLPILYFSIMEALQAVQYLYIGKCFLPENQILTVVGAFHIAFQPLFINMFALYFIPKNISRKILFPVFALCIIGSSLLLVDIYPFEWADKCIPGHHLICGTNICTGYGDYHLTWEMPINKFSNLPDLFIVGYIFTAFLLPFLYGSWKMNLFHIFMGPIFAMSITSNPIEWPIIWCLFSIGVLVIAFCTPLRNCFKVKKWYLWNYPKQKNRRKRKR